MFQVFKYSSDPDILFVEGPDIFIAKSILENYYSDTYEYIYIEKLETEDEIYNKYEDEDIDGYYKDDYLGFIRNFKLNGQEWVRIRYENWQLAPDNWRSPDE
jgi:hypothetical protein